MSRQKLSEVVWQFEKYPVLTGTSLKRRAALLSALRTSLLGAGSVLLAFGLCWSVGKAREQAKASVSFSGWANSEPAATPSCNHAGCIKMCLGM